MHVLTRSVAYTWSINKDIMALPLLLCSLHMCCDMAGNFVCIRRRLNQSARMDTQLSILCTLTSIDNNCLLSKWVKV